MEDALCRRGVRTVGSLDLLYPRQTFGGKAWAVPWAVRNGAEEGTQGGEGKREGVEVAVLV